MDINVKREYLEQNTNFSPADIENYLASNPNKDIPTFNELELDLEYWLEQENLSFEKIQDANYWSSL